MFHTGEGNDTVYVAGKGLEHVGIHTGAGDDVVTVMDETDGACIRTGEGNDSVTISKMTWGSIKTGAGDDFIQADQIGNESQGAPLYNTFIEMGDGNDSALIGTAYSTHLDTGDGINMIRVTEKIAHSAFKTGNGKTEIAIDGDVFNVEFDLQSADDKVSIAGVAKDLLFKLAGKGTQTLIFKNKLLKNVAIMKALNGA